MLHYPTTEKILKKVLASFAIRNSLIRSSLSTSARIFAEASSTFDLCVMCLSWDVFRLTETQRGVRCRRGNEGRGREPVTQYNAACLSPDTRARIAPRQCAFVYITIPVKAQHKGASPSESAPRITDLATTHHAAISNCSSGADPNTSVASSTLPGGWNQNARVLTLPP